MGTVLAKKRKRPLSPLSVQEVSEYSLPGVNRNDSSGSSTSNTGIPKAPKLEIINVFSTCLNIKMSIPSGIYTKSHRIRVCKVGSGSMFAFDGQEKRKEWSTKKSEYMFRGLTVNTEYAVYGMYQIDGTHCWSDESEPVYVTTHDERGRVSVIFIHWLRTLMVDEVLSGEDLLQIMLKYYVIIPFEWANERRTHSFLNISDDRKSFICIKAPPKRQWISVFARGVFSEDIGSMIRWELTLISKAKRMEFGMGYLSDLDRTSPVGSTLHVADGRVPQMILQNSLEWMKWKHRILFSQKFSRTSWRLSLLLS